MMHDFRNIDKYTLLLFLLLFSSPLLLRAQIEIDKGPQLIEQSEYKKAQTYFKSLLDSCKNECNDTTIAQYMVLLGKTEQLLEHFSQSFSLFEEGISLFNKAKNYEGQVNALINLSELYRRIDQHEKALDVIREAKQIADSHSISPRNLAYLYDRYAAVAPGKDLEDSVIFYTKKSLEISIAHDFKKFQASSLNELGYYYFKLKDATKAETYFLRVLNIQKKLKNDRNIAAIYVNLARLYQVLNKDYSKAILYSDSAISLVKNTKWLNSKCEAYKIYSSSKYMLGAFQEARIAHEIYSETVLKIRENQWDRSLVDVEAKYQVEKKESQIIEEKQKSQRYTMYLTASVIIAFIVILLLLRERRLKRIIKTTNTSLKDVNEKYLMLVTESNHRIKNNLQMILSMLDYTSQDVSADSTRTLENISGKIQTISALHRHLNFDVHNEKVFISIYFEEIIEHYQSIQSDPLKIEEHYDDIEIKSERIIYLGLILNELLSNTIEHALRLDTHIKISVITKNGLSVFSYQDGSTLPNNLEGGLGIQLVEELVERLDGIDFNINKSLGRFKFSFKA